MRGRSQYLMDTLEVAVGCDGTLHLPICAAVGGGLTRVPLRLAALLHANTRCRAAEPFRRSVRILAGTALHLVQRGRGYH
jgi:hypothetical protein